MVFGFNRFTFLAAAAAVVALSAATAFAPKAYGAAKEPTDSEITLAVNDEFLFDLAVPSNDIDVETKLGVVTLTGKVDHILAEERAVRVAKTVKGVRAVVDEIQVDPPVYRSDSEVEQAIKDALLFDPRTLSFNVDVTVTAGTATLQGEVSNLKAKRAAMETARNTVGVHRVKNYLRVRPLTPLTDTEIEDNVRQALARDPYVDRYQIAVDVTGGVVHLSGTVDTYFEKTQADDVASRVKGVVDVKNNVVVLETTRPYAYDPFIDDYYPYDYDGYDYQPAPTYRTDAEIESAIRDELWWSPFVDAEDVTVSMNNGVATLTGEVDSTTEMEAARENAYEGGAVWVRNQLNVQ